jgi:hypothetical protein
MEKTISIAEQAYWKSKKISLPVNIASWNAGGAGAN